MYSTLPARDRISTLVTGSQASPLQASSTALSSWEDLPGLSDPIQSGRISRSSGTGNVSNAIAPVSTSLLNISTILLLSDNTMSGATNIGSLTSTRTYSNFVGDSDTQDYYRVTLSAFSNFNLTLTGLATDADVQLLNSAGIQIASSQRGSNNDETINLSSVAGGDYYIRVYQYSGNTNYTLRLSNEYPNNLLATETNVGNVSGTQVFGGSINNNNTSDIYRFSVTDTSISILGSTISIPKTVNITLSGMSADADIRLIQDINNNGLIDGSDVLTSSNNGSNSAEWMSRTLSTGSYFVQVRQFSNYSTNYHLSVSTGDWFSSNLSDAGIIGEARYYGSDGYFSRNDMMAVLREAKNAGSVSAAELTDLRALVNGTGTPFSMPDYVRVLAKDVVYSRTANTNSGIGNLFAGSSATQMENLIGKWFLGTDRPDATGTYRYASGSLVQSGIGFADVDQGSLGDCYFLASLSTVAQRSSSTISSMFIDNYDGTYTVRFYNNGVADYVTVDRYLPVDANGRFIYANRDSGRLHTDTNNELWVALAEKAYAQMNESGWLGQETSINSYNAIDHGNSGAAIRQITGQSTTSGGLSTATGRLDLLAKVNAGKIVVLNTFDTLPTGSTLVADHSYAVTGYNSTTGRFSLQNPHGFSTEVAYSQLASNFQWWDATV